MDDIQESIYIDIDKVRFNGREFILDKAELSMIIKLAEESTWIDYSSYYSDSANFVVTINPDNTEGSIVLFGKNFDKLYKLNELVFTDGEAKVRFRVDSKLFKIITEYMLHNKMPYIHQEPPKKLLLMLEPKDVN